jgi:hypothetical protein
MSLVNPTPGRCLIIPWLMLCSCAPLMKQVDEVPTLHSEATSSHADARGLQMSAAPWAGAHTLRSVGLLTEIVQRQTDLQIVLLDAHPQPPVIYSDGLVPKGAGQELADYLLDGGFFFGNLTPDMEQELRDHEDLGGDDLRVDQLTPDHPLVNCYYDLRSEMNGQERRPSNNGGQGLEWRTALAPIGYFVQGRLAGLGGLSLSKHMYRKRVQTMPVEVKAIINAVVFAHLQRDAAQEPRLGD